MIFVKKIIFFLTYVATDLCTSEESIKNCSMMLKTKRFRKRIKSKFFGTKQKKWFDMELEDEQKELNKFPFCKTSYSYKYVQYCDTVYKYWDKLWFFYKQKKRRKVKFRAKMIYQRELDREVDKLCQPRDNDTRTILLYGNGARTNIFGKTKKNVKGPAKKLYNRIIDRKKAVVIWCDEFRLSKIGFHGSRIKFSRERRERNLRPRKCKSEEHGVNHKGCICFCKEKKCDKERTCRQWCNEHKKRVFQHDVC